MEMTQSISVPHLVLSRVRVRTLHFSGEHEKNRLHEFRYLIESCNIAHENSRHI